MKTLRRLIPVLAVVAALGGLAGSAQAFPPTVTPIAQDFGDQTVGTQSAGKVFTLRNTCVPNPMDLNTCLEAYPVFPSITVSGPFAIRNNTCPPAMPGDSAFPQTCSFEVVFAPTAEGGAFGVVDAGDPLFGKAAVSGTGVLPATRPAKKKCERKKHRKRAAANKRKCRKKKR